VNAGTKLCAICLAAGIQVVASKVNECGDVCEFCFRGELHPAVKDMQVNAARSSASVAAKRKSRWDALVFEVLRDDPGRQITIAAPDHGQAKLAAEGIRTLNRASRKIPGLLVSVRGCVVTVWLHSGAKVERRGGVRFERREAAL